MTVMTVFGYQIILVQVVDVINNLKLIVIPHKYWVENAHIKILNVFFKLVMVNALRIQLKMIVLL